MTTDCAGVNFYMYTAAIVALREDVHSLEKRELHDFHHIWPLSHAANGLLLFSNQKFASPAQAEQFSEPSAKQ